MCFWRWIQYWYLHPLNHLNTYIDTYIYKHIYILLYNRRKFRSQTSDNMDRWKAEVGRVREEKRREEERRSEQRKNQRKEDAGARKSRKVAKHCVFSNDLCLRRVQKVGSLKRGVRSIWPDERWKSAHRCGAKHISKSKMCKTHQLRTTFGSWDVEKVYAVVARSTFPSQNVKSTTCSDHFWTFRCRFAWPAQGILRLVKSRQKKREAFEQFQKRCVGHPKRICKDEFSLAGAVQETC